ncbi:sensor histidine kinase [Caloramator sp. CAR-1]|uniref:ATP-binding protein n=1 Tax=Caloramator sp. CAR-1 TaxID=3062777 RepID=UPI0026E3AC53|nr:sensor histidine kinase [Caloramator sp. CAR-1]MDO6355330.1 sensor histidine kinase [Caloramator sp. CAR-1]
MREISLHIMDIVENSINAEATLIEIEIKENINDNLLTVKIKDNGKGIPKDMLESITDPFVTSRTTRKVGLGLSLFEATCRACNGFLKVSSQVSKGTEVVAVMQYDHIDRPPMGRIEETIVSCLLNPKIDFVYTHNINGKLFSIDTREVKKILGFDDLNHPEVLMWIKEYIKDNLKEIGGGA